MLNGYTPILPEALRRKPSLNLIGKAKGCRFLEMQSNILFQKTPKPNNLMTFENISTVVGASPGNLVTEGGILPRNSATFTAV